ncbi:MAG: hypothetical protein HYX69_15135 [Planctomycetia bacterium]|nr:hypothetical protein [Planctomycetia bacterium]
MRTPSVILAASLAAAVASHSPAATVYFRVAEPSPFGGHRDSYVLPLSNPDDIAAARHIIAQGPLNVADRIVVARIAPGADGINRNLNSPFQTWDWHVTDFLGFAELTAEIYDGWPTFVESDVAGWMANTGGIVGFWSYTVVSELAVPEPASMALFVMGGLTVCACRACATASQKQRGRRRGTRRDAVAIP